jgi:hypothetical protein
VRDTDRRAGYPERVGSRARRAAGVAVAVLVVGWVTVAVLSAQPEDVHAYRKTAVQAAQGALAAVRTDRLAGEAELAGRVLAPYVSVVYDDGRRALATAAHDLTGAEPPTPATARMRDQLAALLEVADARAGDLVAASQRRDGPALRAAADALGVVGDQLDDFITRYR